MAKGFKVKTWHILAIVILFFLWQGGYLTGLATWFQVGEVYYGNVNIVITESNYFDGASETTSNQVYTMWHKATGYKAVTGTSVTATGQVVEVSPDDNGQMYLRLHAGDNHHMADWAIESHNPRVKELWWEDIDQDGTNDLMTLIDVADLGVRGQASTPVLALVLPLIGEEGTMDDDDPSNQTVGTSENVTTITWLISGCAEKYGAYFARIYVTSNSTTGGEDIRFENLVISGLGLERSWANPIAEEDGDYIGYYYKPSDYKEVSEGIPFYRGVNKADAMYVTLTVRCTLTAGERIRVTLKMQTLDSDSAIVAAASISDDVYLIATS